MTRTVAAFVGTLPTDMIDGPPTDALQLVLNKLSCDIDSTPFWHFLYYADMLANGTEIHRLAESYADADDKAKVQRAKNKLAVTAAAR
ncbi:MAG TPA: hypothetical protein VGH44_02790 [Candidatus Saccharimonadia bacterium]|jgi:hypothetical protein